MQVIALLITYFSDDLRNTYMLQVSLRYFASYIRVHPNVAGLYFGKILHINLLSIFVVVAGVPSQYPNVHLFRCPYFAHYSEEYVQCSRVLSPC